MEPEVVVFMPNGDVTLTVIRNVYEVEDVPTKTLAPRRKRLSMVQQTPIDENKQLELEDRELEDLLEDDESILFYAPDAPNSGDGPSRPPSRRVFRGSDASSRRERSSSPPASFWAQLKRQQQAARDETAVVEDEPEPEAIPEKKERKIISSHEVHCVVSSRHMMLASEVFETLLKGDTAAARILRAKGHVKLQVLADFDTLSILLTIIHGPSRKVPRQVTLEELTNLAILVSTLGMTESVQFFSDTWIDALQREGLPKSYNEDVLRLLFVFWVFDRPDEFRNMSRLAQRECNENLLDEAKIIPIPQAVLDAIKREREYGIETAITIVHTLISRYMEGNIICDASLDEDLQYACDAIILGSLMKSSRKINIWPRPEAPFTGTKFRDLARAIRGIRIVDVCNRSSRRAASLGTASNGHGLEDEINASIKDIEAGMDGLELLQYARKSIDHDSALQMFVQPPEIVEEEVNLLELSNSAKPEVDILPEPEKLVEEVKPPPQEPLPVPPTIRGLSNGLNTLHATEESNKKITEQRSRAELEREPYQAREPVDLRYPSRVSDYEVQDPRISSIKDESRPAFPRNSPSQDWLNHGRVPNKQSVDSYSVREPQIKPKEELNVFGERKSNHTPPTPSVPVSEASRDLSYLNNGYIVNKDTDVYQESRNERISAPPKERSVNAEQPHTHDRSPIERRVEKSSSTESFPSSVTQVDLTSQPERVSYGDSPTSYNFKKSPLPEESYYLEKVAKLERTSPTESNSSYAVKQPSASPEISYPHSQRSSYAAPSVPEKPSGQLSQSEKLSQAVSQLEAARAYIERNSHKSKPAQSDPPYQSQRTVQNDRYSPPARSERPAPIDQLSQKPTSRTPVESSHSIPQSQRPVSTLRQSPPAQTDNSSYAAQSAYITSRVPEEARTQSQPQQRSQLPPSRFTQENNRMPQPEPLLTARPQQQHPQQLATAKERTNQPEPTPRAAQSSTQNSTSTTRQLQTEPSQQWSRLKASSPDMIRESQSRPAQSSPQSSYSSTRASQQEAIQQQRADYQASQPAALPLQHLQSASRPTPPPVQVKPPSAPIPPQSRASPPTQYGQPQSQSQSQSQQKATSPISYGQSQTQGQMQQKSISPVSYGQTQTQNNHGSLQQNSTSPVSYGQPQSQYQNQSQLQQKTTAPTSYGQPQNTIQREHSFRDTNNTKEYVVDNISERLTEKPRDTERVSMDADETTEQPHKFNMRKSKKKFSTRF